MACNIGPEALEGRVRSTEPVYNDVGDIQQCRRY